MTAQNTPAEQVLLDYLHTLTEIEKLNYGPETADWAHRSVPALLLAHGRWFTPAPLPIGMAPLPERQCFANAARTERAHPPLIYTEGLALPADSPVPTAHAWCSTPDGHALDPTWSELGGTAYLGIPLATSSPRPHPAFGSGVLERPETMYPLLRHGLPPDAMAAVGRPRTTTPPFQRSSR
ncbi:hypothetical protein [Kitasatospora sp. NPDC059327]|uniref:hypothetical protein n=1 Tax=Kitasatospora sp. NPDC059327 TaxID=3346803 RepID=UPI00367E264B